MLFWHFSTSSCKWTIVSLMKLNKKELLHRNFLRFFADSKNTYFSENHLNGCFCRCFIFRLQYISPASNAKSFRLEITLQDETMCYQSKNLSWETKKTTKFQIEIIKIKLSHPSFSVLFFETILDARS